VDPAAKTIGPVVDCKKWFTIHQLQWRTQMKYWRALMMDRS
jgi:hypothetical protein